MITLMGLLSETFLGVFHSLQPYLITSAMLSLTVASVGALNQTRLKRLFAYSAIGHGGFLLLGLAIGSLESLQAVVIYLIIYVIMSFLSFSFIFSIFRGSSNYIVEIVSISRMNPVLGFTFSLTLLSIAGVPPLAGFLGKFLVLSSAIDSGFVVAAVIAVTCSVISGFYYLRLLKQIMFKDENSFLLKGLSDVAVSSTRLEVVRASIMGLSFYLILTLMLYPNFLLYLAFDTVL